MQAGRDAKVTLHQWHWNAAVVAITAVAALIVLVSSRANGPSDTGSFAHSTTTALPARRVPLFELTPDSPPVLNDETDTVNQQKDVKIKVARHFCTTGVPAVVAETYDPGGACTTFTSLVTIDDEPSGTPVTFSVFADGARVTTKTVPVARSEDISADVTGKRKMTLETTTATCPDVKAAWAWPTLIAP